uniref:Extended synaptotagmin 2 n=1 Tax=Anolis carolinensis TaxID=28377 RepID=A0A803ST04_ANOCA
MSGAGAQARAGPGPGPSGDSEPPPPPPPPSSSSQPMISVDLAGLVSQFARSFALVFPVYVLGYLGLSFSWILLALLGLFWVQRHRGGKASRLGRALAFLQDEERAVKLTVATGDLPAWVHFPDTERAEWLNKTVKHMWPFICQFIEKLFRETIEPAVRGANNHLSTFSFTKIDIGHQPLRINGVKVYTENVDKRQIILDLQISFVGNCEIDLEIKRYFCRAGVKSIQIHGTMRVILEPLLGDMPLIGALSLFFLRKPVTYIHWTHIRLGITFVLELLLLFILSGTAKLSFVRGTLITPYTILCLISFSPLQSGKKINSNPNPLVLLTVGHKAQESKIRYKTNEPVWEENFTFFVHNPRRQELEVEVKDEQHQCSLGNFKLPLNQLLASEDLTMHQRFHLSNSGPNSTVNMKIALRILSLEKQERPPDHQHTAQVKRPSVSKDARKGSFKPQVPVSPAASLNKPPAPAAADTDKKTEAVEKGPPSNPSPQWPTDLSRSSSSLLASNLSYSPSHLSVKEPTPSIASDISLPIATQELRQRLRQLENGTTLGQSPLGQIQLTIRHSSQRNKLMVVVHTCRNLIAFSEEGSDPYVRMYLLPDKKRSGRRKTSVSKKNLNPVFDQAFDYSVSLADLQKRTLDVAVKNSGGFLSKDKGLLGKVS